MGIVYHSHYLAWFEAGRSEFFRELGMPYTEVEKKGIFLPVVEAHVQYKNPAHYDQLIIVNTMMKEIPRGFNMRPSIPDKKNKGRKATMIINVAFRIDARISFDASKTTLKDDSLSALGF